MKRRSALLVATFVGGSLFSWTLSSCAHKKQTTVMNSHSVESVNEAKRRWKSQEDILSGILDGGRFTEEEFTSAVDFFQGTTRIPSHDSGTYIGRVPNEKLREDFQHWKDWYKQNESFLYWNADTGRIEVDEKAKSRIHTSQ